MAIAPFGVEIASTQEGSRPRGRFSERVLLIGDKRTGCVPGFTLPYNVKLVKSLQALVLASKETIAFMTYLGLHRHRFPHVICSRPWGLASHSVSRCRNGEGARIGRAHAFREACALIRCGDGTRSMARIRSIKHLMAVSSTKSRHSRSLSLFLKLDLDGHPPGSSPLPLETRILGERPPVCQSRSPHPTPAATRSKPLLTPQV